ncbi:MAG: flagellar protein FliT [Sulfuricellaceae bacterium]|nr:flagellar protein FliT [Sulfuricellaceae bacterium]
MASFENAGLTPSEVLSLYERLRVLSSQMLKNAREENWEELTGKELERVGLIEKLRSLTLEQESEPQFVAAKSRLIHSILEMDQEIRDITGSRLAEIKSDLDSISSSKKLNNAYGS